MSAGVGTRSGAGAWENIDGAAPTPTQSKSVKLKSASLTVDTYIVLFAILENCRENITVVILDSIDLYGELQ
jgi:hypothetical protein